MKKTFLTSLFCTWDFKNVLSSVYHVPHKWNSYWAFSHLPPMTSAQYRHGKLLKHLKMRKSSKPNVIVTLLFERKKDFINFYSHPGTQYYPQTYYVCPCKMIIKTLWLITYLTLKHQCTWLILELWTIRKPSLIQHLDFVLKYSCPDRLGTFIHRHAYYNQTWYTHY